MSESEWRSCVELNRTRASSIIATAREPTPGESIQAHVWSDLVARRTKAKEIPLIPLSVFGFFRDEMGLVNSSELRRLGSGKEATAWGDEQAGCVYKMFNLFLDDQKKGRLGQKIEFHMENDFECSITFVDADIYHVVEKLRILHEVGACPTEILGLTEGGYFLASKQILCKDHKNLAEDRQEAVKAIKAIIPTGSYRQQVWVFWADRRAWAISDLHKGNIMRMASGHPTIIDALIGEIPEVVLKQVTEISRAVSRAKRWRETGVLEEYDVFKGTNDDDL